MGTSRLTLLIGLASCLTGCVIPAPPSGRQISRQDVSAMITVGSTTETEVIERLRQASGTIALKEGRFLVAGGGRSAGGVLLITRSHEKSVDFGASTAYWLLVEFDERRIARRYEFQTRGEPLATARERIAPPRTLVRDQRFYLSVAFSPDGKALAAGTEGNRVLRWQLSDTAEPLSLAGELSCRQIYDGQARNAPWVYSVAFAPDGRSLAAGGFEGVARVWDVVSGKTLLTFEGHGTAGCWTWPQRVFGVAYAPDGRRVATQGDRATKVWDAVTGRELLTMTSGGFLDRTRPPGIVTFSPDGRRLAAARGGATVTIWDSSTGKELGQYRRDGSNPPGIAFSPAGDRMAINWCDFVEVKRITPEGALGELEGLLLLPSSPHALRAVPITYRCPVSFASSGRRLAVAADGLAVWDTDEWRRVWQFTPQIPGEIWDIKFSPDGTLVATAGSRGIELWAAETHPVQ